MTVRELQKLNNLKGELIYAGNKLKVYHNKKNTSVNNQATNQSSAKHLVYTVKSGDTLLAIALKHQTTVSVIKRINNKRSDLIFPGDKLKIPGK
jgi:LysM repeat protein